VLDYNCNDIGKRKKEIQYSSRCDKNNNIHVLSVDNQRLVKGENWLTAALEEMA